MIDRALCSSDSAEWETPQWLFDRLDAVFKFRLDVCATPANAKCKRYFTRAQDGLARAWSAHKRVWMNPPYGRAIGPWMEKAFTESRKGCIVACLVPARTSSRWWHDWVQDRAQVVFVRGRLQFRDGDGRVRHPAPFPSAVVIYGLDLERRINGDCEDVAAHRALSRLSRSRAGGRS